MSLLKKIEISVAIALVVSIIFSVFSFAKTSDEVRNEVLRLHVLANSDSEADQKLKISVRDAILSEGAEVFDGTVTVENAIELITPETERLEQIAEKVVSDNGFDYRVSVSIGKEYFETRTYEDITLPAGEYLSLIVRIGEAKGKNWWCVMFPTMCVTAADKNTEIDVVFSEKQIELVKRKPKYEPRFKIVEIYESLKNKFKN